MLGVSQVHIGDDIHDPAVGLLGQALILAAVAGFHVEDGDVQTLGCNSRQAGVGIAQDQQRIGLDGSHQLVRAVDDVANGGAQIIAHGIHIDLRIRQFQILEEDTVQVIVIVLAGVGQNAVEILPAFVDNSRQTDDLRPGANNDQKLQFAVILKGNIGIIQSDIHIKPPQRKCRACWGQTAHWPT